MSYPEFKEGESVCAYCKNDLENEYVTIRDNHLILNYFDYENGEDNMFCDNNCLARGLFVETVYVEGAE